MRLILKGLLNPVTYSVDRVQESGEYKVCKLKGED